MLKTLLGSQLILGTLKSGDLLQQPPHLSRYRLCGGTNQLIQHICWSTNNISHFLPSLSFPPPSGCLTRPPNPFLPQLVLKRTQRALAEKFQRTPNPCQHQLIFYQPQNAQLPPLFAPFPKND